MRASSLLLIAGLFTWTVLPLRAEMPLPERIDQLVRQLNDDRADRRDEAEQTLLKLAPTDNANECDAYLEKLPQPIDGMPPEVRLRLARVRKLIENEQASAALAPSRLTLSAKEMPLGELLDEIYQQTGNRLVDHREQFGQDASPRKVSIEIEDELFWPALDKILDLLGMTTYPFSGEESLAVIDRDQQSAPRAEGASYAGPFRIQATDILSRRNLRAPEQQGMRVEVEFSWEPRLRPIALTQAVDKIDVIADDRTKLALATEQAVLNVEVQPGSHATELTIPLELPPRSVSRLLRLRGQMSALVPGRTVEFKFADLKNATPATQSRGGVSVTLQGFRKSQDLWELQMRLRIDSDETGLESHRGWVFQNRTYLQDEQGNILDHAGFETTMQSNNEVGLTYLFELSDEAIEDYTWIYRTPAAIVRTPVEYELKDITLP